jgi:hypothetical protein
MKEWQHTRKSNQSSYQIDFEDDTIILQSVQPAAPSDIGAVQQPEQLVPFHRCRGKRVRFQSELSAENADGAGLWLTASHKDWHITDGMYDRLIKGSSDWRFVQLVIDVPPDAAYITYGLWMIGNGKCRMRNPRFDIVEQSVRLTTDKIWDRVGAERWVERSLQCI